MSDEPATDDATDAVMRAPGRADEPPLRPSQLPGMYTGADDPAPSERVVRFVRRKRKDGE